MYIQKIHLNQFRNHEKISLELFKRPTVFHGLNGSGKTNILEAISLFTVGKGLRSATYDEMGMNDNFNRTWDIRLQMGDDDLPSIDCSVHYRDKKRLNYIQGNPVQSSKSFNEWITLFWLTCEHDRLFIDSSKARRKFLDRMVFNIDSQHAQHLAAYEKLSKERLSLLENGHFNSSWIESIEQHMHEYAFKIYISRSQIIDHINHETQNLDPIFPKLTLSLTGEYESIHKEHTSEIASKLIKEKWVQSRHMDQQRHMTHFGVHRSDLNVLHHVKGNADQCSTGEQKILLMGLVLSFLSHRMKTDERLILVLLDECLSHFDFRHRMVLFKQIEKFYQSDQYLGSMHVFMTGTDRVAFEPLESFATYHEIGHNI